MSAEGSGPANNRPIVVTGYAIVSDDDRIAGADGLVPPSLRNERDWEHYQRELATSDLIVFGHRSHRLEPNERGDRRIVVWSAPIALVEREDAWWWNPAHIAWPQVAETLLPRGGRVAAPGGQGVFDLFLGIGYDAFHLSRAHGVKLPGGRAIFSACGGGQTAEAVLTLAGLSVSETIALDPQRGVDMTIWRRMSGE